MAEQAEDGRVSSERHIHVAADLWKYGKGEVLDGQMTVEACAATYIDKKEDRHIVSFGSKEMEDCQRVSQNDIPRMAAFFGVFDGHDGARAAEYCYKGLLPHILSETQYCMLKHNKQRGGSKVKLSLVQTGIINAFHHAQTRFGNKMSPPTFQDVKNGVKATRFDNKGSIARMCGTVPRKRKPRGGTTALTLSIYGEYVEGSGDVESFRPMPCAVVANTGDCRLITDDGTGSHNYRQVTTDHRPDDPDERDRLSRCVRKGTAVLGREAPAPAGVLRVYPGGLAVSRSVGDLRASKAIICTPDIFQVTITGDGKTHRLVLGSDGLWDVMTNEEVGQIVCRLQKKKTEQDEIETSASTANEGMNTDVGGTIIVDPNEAASKLMEECLHNGGHMDDVTILIVDVTATVAATHTKITNNI